MLSALSMLALICIFLMTNDIVQGSPTVGHGLVTGCGPLETVLHSKQAGQRAVPLDSHRDANFIVIAHM